MKSKLRLLAWAAAGTVIVGVLAVNRVLGTTPGLKEIQVAESVEMENAQQSARSDHPNAPVMFNCSSPCDMGTIFANHGSR